MNASAKKLRLCVALLILNVAVIWGSSLLPGSVSGAVSGWVHQLLARLFGYSPEAQAGHGLLRKLAHVTEFACLGACFAWLLSLLGKQPANRPTTISIASSREIIFFMFVSPLQNHWVFFSYQCSGGSS